jgi:hypothetical protein
MLLLFRMLGGCCSTRCALGRLSRLRLIPYACVFCLLDGADHMAYEIDRQYTDQPKASLVVDTVLRAMDFMVGFCCCLSFTMSAVLSDCHGAVN